MGEGCRTTWPKNLSADISSEEIQPQGIVVVYRWPPGTNKRGLPQIMANPTLGNHTSDVKLYAQIHRKNLGIFNGASKQLENTVFSVSCGGNKKKTCFSEKNC